MRRTKKNMARFFAERNTSETFSQWADRVSPPVRRKTERCPTCAQPVYSIFDHVARNCRHN